MNTVDQSEQTRFRTSTNTYKKILSVTFVPAGTRILFAADLEAETKAADYRTA